jgi:hypothetical protein
MMVMGAIEGFTNSKADQSPQPLESTPAMESQPPMKSLSSLAVSDAIEGVEYFGS